MPVKVRCPNCQKVLNAPDKARGKSLKCPSCEGRVRVPGGSSTAAPAAKRKPPRKRGGGDDFLGGVDINRLEDRSANVCPKCGATVYESDEVCGACGIDLETGKVRVKRRGPDPSRFYSEAWSDSWKFMLENKKLAFFSGFVWTLFFVLYVGGSAATGALHQWETGRAIEADKEEIAKAAKIQPEPGQQVQQRQPISQQQAQIRAITKPPVIVCGFMTLLMALGGPGWYWTVSAKVIEQTMQKKKKLEMRKVQFDFFTTVIIGFKAYFWPYVLLMPVLFISSFLIVPLVIAGSLAVAAFGAIGLLLIPIGMYCIPLFVFPIAQVHMTMPYTYKAFLPWDMLKDFFKNIGPALYWLVMLIAVMSPAIILLVVLLVFFGSQLGPTVAGWVVDSTRWLVDAVGENPDEPGFIYKTILITIATIMLATTSAFFFIPLSFPALFLMRANGLLGYYNRRSMDLVASQKPDVPCGFWVRYLAAMIDGLIMLIAMALLNIAFDIARFGLNLIGYDFTLRARLWAFLGIFVIMPMYYYAKSESGIFQGTLGKRSLGIKVTNINGDRITMGQALGRYWGKVISGMFFGAGLIMAGLTEKKQALHDTMAKSLVVWEGDADGR